MGPAATPSTPASSAVKKHGTGGAKQDEMHSSKKRRHSSEEEEQQQQCVRANAHPFRPSTSTSQSAHHQKPPLGPNASSSKKRRMAEAKPPPPPLDSNDNHSAAVAAAAAAAASTSVFETTSSSNAPIPGAPWNAPIPGAPPTSSNVMHGPLPQPPGESSNHDTKMPARRATPPVQAPPKSFPTLISEVRVKSLVEHGFKPLKSYEVTILRNMTNTDTLELQEFITNKVAVGDFALSNGTNSELIFQHERKDERNDVRIFKIEVENKSGNGGIRKMKDCGILVADDLDLQQALVFQQFQKAQEQRMVGQSEARRSLPRPISWIELNKSIRDNFCVQNFPSTGSSERMLALKETHAELAKTEQASIDSSPQRVVEQGRYITHLQQSNAGLQQSLTTQQDITVAVLQQRARGGNVNSISSPSLASRCDSVPNSFNPNDHLLGPVARNLHLGFGAPTSTGIDGFQQQQQQQQQPPSVVTVFGRTTTVGSSAGNSSASAGFGIAAGAGPAASVSAAAPHNGPLGLHNPASGSFGMQQQHPSPSSYATNGGAASSFGGGAHVTTASNNSQFGPSTSSFSFGGNAAAGGAAGSFGGGAHATTASNNSQFGPSTSSFPFGSNAAAGGAAGSFGVAQQPGHVGQQPQHSGQSAYFHTMSAEPKKEDEKGGAAAATAAGVEDEEEEEEEEEEEDLEELQAEIDRMEEEAALMTKDLEEFEKKKVDGSSSSTSAAAASGDGTAATGAAAAGGDAAAAANPHAMDALYM